MKYITQNLKRDWGQLKYRGITDENFVFSELKNYSSVSIYVKIDYLERFLYIFSKIDNFKGKIVLITGNSDYSFDYSKLMCVLNSSTQEKKIIRVYAQNVTVVHPLVVPVPIGIIDEVIDVFSNVSGNSDHFSKLNSAYYKEKILKPYMNFSIWTNPTERQNLFNKFENKTWVIKRNSNISQLEFFKELTTYFYSFSPAGNGIDCHRTWECIYSGVIPIIRTTQAMQHFSALPILYVNEWDEVTEDLLIKSYPYFKQLLEAEEYIKYSSYEYVKMIDNDLSQK
jgi:hypothetical protein